MDCPRRLWQLLGPDRHPQRRNDRLNGIRTSGGRVGGTAGERGPFLAAVLAEEVTRRVERHEDTAGGQCAGQPCRPFMPRPQLAVHEAEPFTQRQAADLEEMTAKVVVELGHPEVGVRPVILSEPGCMHVAEKEIRRAIARAAPPSGQAALLPTMSRSDYISSRLQE